MRRLPLFGAVVAIGILACRPAQPTQRLEPVAAEPMPRFPDMLRAAQLSGVVELAIPVAADGSVAGSPRAIESTHDLFLHAARTAVRQWRFRPTDAHATLRVDTARVRFTFALDSSSRCGPMDITLRPGDSTRVRVPAAAPVHTFDARTLRGSVTACAIPRTRYISY